MMNNHEFAAAAHAAVETVTKSESNFYCGSLFVRCDSLTAAKIKTALREALGCGVVVSKVGPEFAFDFI
jgi:hypothetical protein